MPKPKDYLTRELRLVVGVVFWAITFEQRRQMLHGDIKTAAEFSLSATDAMLKGLDQVGDRLVKLLRKGR